MKELSIKDGGLMDEDFGIEDVGDKSPAADANTGSVHVLDKIFRLLTPLIYVIFCCTYFGYYLINE